MGVHSCRDQGNAGCATQRALLDDVEEAEAATKRLGERGFHAHRGPRRRGSPLFVTFSLAVTCLALLAPADAGVRQLASGVSRGAGAPYAWKHQSMIDSMKLTATQHQTSVEALVSDVGKHFSEVDSVVDKVRTLLDSPVTSPGGSEEEEEEEEKECPDWVDQLGAPKGDVGGDESWIDGSLSSTPAGEMAEKEDEKYLGYGGVPQDFLQKDDVRVTDVGIQQHPRPPQLKRTMSMEDVVLERSVEEAKVKPINELVCFLDLDKCSIYGQDGNDLTIACQWMQGGMEKLCGLYRRMVNPQIKPLFRQLQMTVEKIPVVLYTMRPQLLRYKSAVRNCMLLLHWKPDWHHNDDQICIPSDIENPTEIINAYSGDTPLHPHEKADLAMSWQRLLAIRKVIRDELDLDYNPRIVVTSIMKDLQGTASKLGLPAEKSYLWDDNQVLKGQPHVLTVDPYVGMDREHRTDLLSYMEKVMPVHTLTADVVEFMMGAKPDLCSIRTNDNGVHEYVIHESPESRRFPIPDLPLRYTTPHFMAMSVEDGEGGVKPVGGGKGPPPKGKYHSEIVEYYTASWRRADVQQRLAIKEWEDVQSMVW